MNFDFNGIELNQNTQLSNQMPYTLYPPDTYPPLSIQNHRTILDDKRSLRPIE